MKDYKQASQSSFNKQSNTYDHDIRGEHARQLYSPIMKTLNESRWTSILDVGCGTGELLNQLLEKAEKKELYGLDISEKMLSIAKRKLGTDVTLIQGDSERLPFPDDKFDVIICNDSFHHYPNPQNVLSEIYRVLTRGGRFIIGDCWQPPVARQIMNAFFKICNDGDVRIYSESEITNLLKVTGFLNIKWEQINRTSFLVSGKK